MSDAGFLGWIHTMAQTSLTFSQLRARGQRLGPEQGCADPGLRERPALCPSCHPRRPGCGQNYRLLKTSAPSPLPSRLPLFISKGPVRINLEPIKALLLKRRSRGYLTPAGSIFPHQRLPVGVAETSYGRLSFSHFLPTATSPSSPNRTRSAL